MLGKISTKHNERTITTWNNGAVGAIEDIDSNCIFRFIQYLIDDNGSCRSIYKPREERQQPIVCYGFVGWLLHNRAKRIKDIFEGYYNARKEVYRKAHEHDADAWQRDLAKEFMQVHEAEERRCIEASKALYDYLPNCNAQFISERCENYLKYVQSKLATDEKPNEVQDKTSRRAQSSHTFKFDSPKNADKVISPILSILIKYKKINPETTSQEFINAIRDAKLEHIISDTTYLKKVVWEMRLLCEENWFETQARNIVKDGRSLDKLKEAFRTSPIRTDFPASLRGIIDKAKY